MVEVMSLLDEVQEPLNINFLEGTDSIDFQIDQKTNKMKNSSLSTYVIYCCLAMLFMCSSSKSFAQNISLSSTVMDEDSESLSAATVVLLAATDSTIISFCITNNEGYFKLSQLKAGNYILQVSYIGLRNYSEEISLSNGEVKLTTIVLKPSDELLQEVNIEAKHIPIGIKERYHQL